MPVDPALSGRRVLVLGLGAFGGGAGCARALAKLGAEVTVTDLRPAAELREALDLLQGLPVRYALGGHDEALFQTADWVVVNPAVPEDSPWLALARRCGCSLTTDVNLALERAGGVPALAVTGTHGKSSCAALAAHLLRSVAPRTVLAGNLGGSLLDAVEGLGATDRLVVELSSFQTERLEAPPGWPRVAALTSLGADHLDRHGTVQAYHEAKRRLLAFQDREGTVLLPIGLEDAASWAAAARGRVLWLASGPLPAGREGWGVDQGQLAERRDGRERALFAVERAPFRESYRLPSLLAAVGAARLLGVAAEGLEEALAGFVGLPHRMERIEAGPSFTLLDNGVATHPEPTIAALRELTEPVLLLAGGKDKGLPLEALAEACSRCRQAFLFGGGGRRLAELCRERGIPTSWHEGVAEAACAALSGLREGEILLFSPSFSSYDQFRNFRDRAAVFRNLCRDFVEGRRSRPVTKPSP